MAFVELRCDMLCLSEMGEVQKDLESAFAEAEFSSRVAQPAIQEVHEDAKMDGIQSKSETEREPVNLQRFTAWCPGSLCSLCSCLRVVSERVSTSVTEAVTESVRE